MLTITSTAHNQTLPRIAMISNAYHCRLNVRGKTEQGLVGNSQALPLRSGYSVHSAFLRIRNCNSGIWFLSHSWCHTRGWLLLRTSWRRILPEPFRLYSFPFCIVHLRIRWPSRGQRRKTDTLFSTLNDHDDSKKKMSEFSVSPVMESKWSRSILRIVLNYFSKQWNFSQQCLSVGHEAISYLSLL